MKIKTTKEISEYLKDQMEKQGLKQAGLAERMLQLGDDSFSKNQLTDNISKWLKGDRYPGTEYLFYLSQALKITIENILTAGESNEKYDDRITLYAVAKDYKLNLIDKFMNQNQEVFINYDEFDKTLIDYAIEFKNINLIKYLFDKKIIRFDDQVLISPFRVMLYNGTERFTAILDMIIENDEVEYFKLMVNRGIVVNRHTDEVDMRKIVLTDNTLRKVLKSQKILNYLMEEYIPNQQEWAYYNPWIIPGDSRIRQLKMLSGWFNEVLRVAIQNQDDKISQKFLQIGIKHNKEIAEVFANQNYIIDEDFCVKSRASGYECLNILAGCDLVAIPSRLKQQIQELNASIQKCGKRMK